MRQAIGVGQARANMITYRVCNSICGNKKCSGSLVTVAVNRGFSRCGSLADNDDTY